MHSICSPSRTSMPIGHVAKYYATIAQITINRSLEEIPPRPGVSGVSATSRGEGTPGMLGGPNGDLYLLVTVHPHPLFERKGPDLYVEVPVPLVVGDDQAR
ncbi:MAG: hypothetical protein HYU51_18895 [Candidatus Rokubacteria bacterium]|nr:hypothetical protein [Candidatus Rokubacteria bacterium]